METISEFKCCILDTLEAPLYSDCVYFYPLPDGDILISIGLYHLFEKENITKGGFCIYKVNKENKFFFLNIILLISYLNKQNGVPHSGDI